MTEPPPLKASRFPETVDKIKVKPGDSVLLLREDGTVEVYCQVGKDVNMGALTALGLYWTLENEEWRIKMCKKAKARVEDIIAGRGEV